MSILRTSLLVVFSAIAPLTAQCVNPWLPENALGGADGRLFDAVTWDPDGSGPLSPVVAVVGSFSLIGTTPVSMVASYDPATGVIAPIGGGVTSPPSGQVHVADTLPNGDLIIAGAFGSVGGVSAPAIARFDGTSWSPLGTWPAGTIWMMTAMPNGDVVAGTNDSLYRWDGAAWTTIVTLAPGVSWFRTVAVNGNGDVIAGGKFTTIGGVAANNIARWDGSNWWPLGSGVDNLVGAVCVMPNGDLVAGGFFGSAGGASADHIARWDGAAWSPLGAGVNDLVQDLEVTQNGELVATGWFTMAGGVTANSIARWSGNSWSAVGTPTLGAVPAVVELASGELLALAEPVTFVGTAPTRLLRSNGAVWTSAVDGMDNLVTSVAALANGDLLAAGSFTRAGAFDASGIARKTAAGWVPLGGGIEGYPVALAELPNGDLVVGGTLGSSNLDGALVWDGATWSPLGGGIAIGPSLGRVSAFAKMPNGDLVVAGQFLSAGTSNLANLARWNGTTWSGFGSSPNGGVTDVDVLPNGDVVIVGAFSSVGGVAASGVARWNGATWSGLGTGLLGTPLCLEALPNGDVYVSGFIADGSGASLNGTARWNGTVWSSVGQDLNGRAFALQELPNGDLLAVGEFWTVGGVFAPAIARWNGATWSPVGAGLRNTESATLAFALDTLPNGDVVVGGNFHLADGLLSPFVAKLSTSCPASAVAFGSGCTGSGGANVLVAETQPWIGSTYRATATGMPTQAVAFSVVGFNQIAVPLPSILPIGGTGCALLVSTDYLEVLLPSAGEVAVQLAFPNATNLTGMVLYHQVVPLGIDPSLNLTEFTSSNALTLTLGAF